MHISNPVVSSLVLTCLTASLFCGCNSSRSQSQQVQEVRLSSDHDHPLGIATAETILKHASQANTRSGRVLLNHASEQLRFVRAAHIEQIECFINYEDSPTESQNDWNTYRRIICEQLVEAFKGVDVVFTCPSRNADAELSVHVRIDTPFVSYMSTEPGPVGGWSYYGTAEAHVEGRLFLKLKEGACYARDISWAVSAPPKISHGQHLDALGMALRCGVGTAASNLVADVFLGRDPFLAE